MKDDNFKVLLFKDYEVLESIQMTSDSISHFKFETLNLDSIQINKTRITELTLTLPWLEASKCITK